MHAFLIMAHNNFEILEALITCLDDNQSDFYIHVDARAKNFDENKIKAKVNKSKLFFLKQKKIKWGSYSQIQCELNLMKAALNNKKYSYIHLLSGVDLPIKRKEEIFKFFEENDGKEFIDIDQLSNLEMSKQTERIKFFYPLQGLFGKKSGLSIMLQNQIINLQKVFRINRIRKREDFYKKGANWFSITDKLARFVLEKESEIKKTYSYGWCVDEIFLQTIVWNSNFKSSIAENNLRLIDWNRGTPYTFKKCDYEELVNSEKLFARKFDSKEDGEIVKMIEKLIKQ